MCSLPHCLKPRPAETPGEPRPSVWREDQRMAMRQRRARCRATMRRVAHHHQPRPTPRPPPSFRSLCSRKHPCIRQGCRLAPQRLPPRLAVRRPSTHHEAGDLGTCRSSSRGAVQGRCSGGSDEELPETDLRASNRSAKTSSLATSTRYLTPKRSRFPAMLFASCQRTSSRKTMTSGMAKPRGLVLQMNMNRLRTLY